MKAGAARFLQENQIPRVPPDQKPDPVAQSVVDLTARAAGLRDKIQSASRPAAPRERKTSPPIGRPWPTPRVNSTPRPRPCSTACPP